jgi:hypothetical protein
MRFIKKMYFCKLFLVLTVLLIQSYLIHEKFRVNTFIAGAAILY